MSNSRGIGRNRKCKGIRREIQGYELGTGDSGIRILEGSF